MQEHNTPTTQYKSCLGGAVHIVTQDIWFECLPSPSSRFLLCLLPYNSSKAHGTAWGPSRAATPSPPRPTSSPAVLYTCTAQLGQQMIQTFQFLQKPYTLAQHTHHSVNILFVASPIREHDQQGGQHVNALCIRYSCRKQDGDVLYIDKAPQPTTSTG